MTTILVVEDDSSVAQMLTDVLRAKGFDVLVESDGEWGMRTFESKPCDMVIVDVLVPKLQGFDLIGRIRETEKGASIPILVISGVYKSASYKEQITERFQVVDYLDKPVDLDHLFHVMRKVFRDEHPAPRSTSGLPFLPEIVVATEDDQEEPEVPIKGEIEEIPFARLLGALFSSRATGALLLRKSSVKKIVYFQEGIPVFVKSNLLSECLGRIMVAERLISEKECEESLRRRKQERIRQGQILVKMGSISQHNLDFALELQMQIKLFDVFSWLEGRFQFNSTAEFEGPQIALPMAPAAMIYEGASRTMSAERIRRDLDLVIDKLVRPSADPTFRYQALQLDPQSARLLDRIDGRTKLQEVLEQSELPEERASLLIYALSCTGLLRLDDLFPEVTHPGAKPISLEDNDVVSITRTEEINAQEELEKAAQEPELAPGEEPPALGDWGEQITNRPSSAPIIAPPRSESGEQEPDPTAFDEEPTEAIFDSAPLMPMPTVVPPPDEEVVAPPFPEALSASAPTPAPELEPQEAVAEPEPELIPEPEPELIPEPEPELIPEPEAVEPQPATSELDSDELSEDLRRQVRARLEAEAARLSTPPKKPVLKPSAYASSAPKPIVKVPSEQPVPSRMQAPRLDLDKERSRQLEELKQRYTELCQKNLYELLEIDSEAPIEEIQEAYKKVSRSLDPDRAVPGTTSFSNRKLAEQIFLLLTRALNTLTNEEARERYDRALNGEQPRDASILAAERSFEHGMTASEQGDWDNARAWFAVATEQNPNEGIYWAHRGWSTYSSSPTNQSAQEEAIGYLDRAVDHSPRCEEAYLFRARVRREIGDPQQAIRDFEIAVRCNPDCVDALTALRALQPPTAKKGGFFSRLVGS